MKAKFKTSYNFRLLDNGRIKGRDDFPANRSLTVEDIPYCEKHFYEMKKRSKSKRINSLSGKGEFYGFRSL